jgi:protocatechuate 3,4-dioxygenase beta subunit
MKSRGVRVTSVAIVALAAMAVTATSARSLGAQARDTSVAPTTPGIASITGVVVTDDGRRPVRRATVTVSGQALRTSKVMATDDNGRFKITGLVPGTYSATVTKPGYVTTVYGSRRPGRGPGQPVVVTETQRTADLTIPLSHGAVITGTILDPFGRPLPEVRVSVSEVRVINGERRITNTFSSAGPTDDHGVYRLWGLAPGTFVVSAVPSGSLPNNSTIRPITPQDLEWAQQAAGTNAAHAATAPAPDAGHPVGYSTVYYPGVVDVASAGTVTISGSEERGGITFSLQFVPTARIDATVLGIDGQALTSGVQLMLTSPPGSAGSPGSGTSSRSLGFDRASGTFSAQGVAPGNYVLTARGSSRPIPLPAPPPPLPFVASPGLPPPPPPPPAPVTFDLWASADMPISGQDVNGIVLALRPGMTVSGKIVFEGKTTPPPELTRVMVGLGVATNDGLAASGPARPAAADGTFSVTGITPGRYRPTVNVTNGGAAGGAGGGRGGGGVAVPVPVPVPAPVPGPGPGVGPQAGWRVKSAMWNGRDLMDLPLQVRPNEDVGGIVVTLTDEVTDLSGKLQTTSGAPATGYSVIVFPTDRTLWVQNSRRIRMIQPGPDGVYRTTGLPAGTYYLGAVTDADSNDLGDTEFLDQLAAASLKITLTDGGKVVQDLRLKAEKDFGSPFYDLRK